MKRLLPPLEVVKPIGWLLLAIGLGTGVVAGVAHWRELAVLSVACLALLVLAAIVLVLASVTVFARNEILNTDRFAATMAPLYKDEEVRAAIAVRVNGAVNKALDTEKLVAEAHAAGRPVDPQGGVAARSVFIREPLAQPVLLLNQLPEGTVNAGGYDISIDRSVRSPWFQAGTVGTFAACAMRFAAVLSPNISSNSGVGPTKTISFSSHARASPAFSARNPYPG